jgi:integrase/recombinase XerD
MRLETVVKGTRRKDGSFEGGFLQAKRRVGKSERTIDAYDESLRLFIDHVKHEYGRDDVRHFTAAAVNGWLDHMAGHGLSLATRALRLTALRELAKFGVRHRYWTTDPTADVDAIRRNKQLPIPFTPEERDALMRLPLAKKEDVALRAILNHTGAREAEICEIRLGDFRRPSLDGAELGELRIHGKGGVERLVHLHSECWAAVEAFVHEKYGPTVIPNQAPLFELDGRAWKPAAVWRRVRAWGERAGVTECRPHRFRHRFACDALESGVDPRTVQVLLGHASLATTQGYLQVTDKRRQDAIRLMMAAETRIERCSEADPSPFGRPRNEAP